MFRNSVAWYLHTARGGQARHAACVCARRGRQEFQGSWCLEVGCSIGHANRDAYDGGTGRRTEAAAEGEDRARRAQDERGRQVRALRWAARAHRTYISERLVHGRHTALIARCGTAHDVVTVISPNCFAGIGHGVAFMSKLGSGASWPSLYG